MDGRKVGNPLGELMKELRTRAGVKSAEVSRLWGTSSAYPFQVESGKSGVPSDDRLESFSELLQLSPEDREELHFAAMQSRGFLALPAPRGEDAGQCPGLVEFLGVLRKAFPILSDVDFWELSLELKKRAGLNDE